MDPFDKPEPATGPSLYSLHPDLFEAADQQMWDWEARETGVRPRCPQITLREEREKKDD
jgi:hypothetical protein